MTRLKFSLLLLPLFLLATPLLADVVENLYVAEVPVESQDRQERQLVIGSAMREVLLRVSGQNLVLTVTPIEQALMQPTRYVQRYRYETREVEGETRKVLKVRFDEAAINRLLRSNRLPVWGKTRPATLVWLVIDDGKGRHLLSNDSENEARQIIENQSRLRGLPLRLPLYDLTDRAKLSISDVWGNFEDTILTASRRYQPEAVLVGRVYRTFGNRWKGRWTLHVEGRRLDWESEGETLQTAMLPGIAGTADQLAQRYARVEENQQPDQVLVRIKAVNSLRAYNKAVNYLASLETVSKVMPREVTDSSILLELTSRNGRLAVSQAIALGHTLVAAAAMPVVGAPSDMSRTGPVEGTTALPAVPAVRADLTYQLVP